MLRFPSFGSPARRLHENNRVLTWYSTVNCPLFSLHGPCPFSYPTRRPPWHSMTSQSDIDDFNKSNPAHLQGPRLFRIKDFGEWIDSSSEILLKSRTIRQCDAHHPQTWDSLKMLNMFADQCIKLAYDLPIQEELGELDFG